MDTDVHVLYRELFNAEHYAFTVASLPHFAAAAAAAIVGLLVVWWERASRPSQFFAGFCLVFLLWATGRGVSLMMSEPDMVLFLSRRLYVLIMLAIPVLYQFTQIMVRAEAERANMIRAVWAMAIFFSLGAFTSDSMIPSVQRYAWGYEPMFGPLGIASMAWIAILIGLTGWNVWHAWSIAPADSNERRRLAWYGFAMAVLYCSAIEFLPGLGIEIFPMASGPYIGFTVVSAYLVYHYGFAEVTPEMAARGIANRIRGALLMMDAEGIVQFANRHCEAILGLEEGRLIGRAARSLLGENFEIGRLSVMAAPGNSDLEKEWTHVNMRTGQPQDLAMSTFAVTDSHDREVAYVCMLRDLTEQKRLEEERRTSTLKDTLTALPNRAVFLADLDDAIRKQREGAAEFSVHFIGLHRMRVINEELGFAVGDRVLVEVAERLRPLLQPADEMARVGGDEFAILHQGAADPNVAREFAERVLAAIRVPLVHAEGELHVAAAIGIATSLRSYSSGAEMLRDASIAMYRAKEHASGITFIGAGGIAGRRTQLEAELRKALQGGQLSVHYQPIVDLERRSVAGFEALVRWWHPERGLVRPDAFLPLAEEVGLIAEIDDFVLRQACADLFEFQRRANDPSLSVSVNMSEAFLGQPNLPRKVVEVIAEHHLEAVDLRIELLERVAQLNPLQDVLRALRSHGIGLYVDDFGTGYSALSRLHEAPVTALKIDRAFVRTLPMGGGGEKVVSTILSLANNLGLSAIAEGVTTNEELRRLQLAGCPQAQGFLFAKALPFDEALAWTLDRRGLARRLEAA